MGDADYNLQESFGKGFAFAEATTDRDDRLIRDVSLLGKRSQNGHTYTDAALRESTGQLKGAGVFVDHPMKSELRERSGTRSVRDLTGKVISARVNGDRVKGDVKVLEGEDGDRLLALAEQMPGAAGFSIRGAGEKRRDGDGNVFVESVTEIGGADVVVDPATTDGLFESINTDGDETMEDLLEELTEDQLREERPDIVESIRESGEASRAELEETISDLRGKLDEAETKLRERDHRDLVEEKLSEADLPDRVVTETFREQLIAADEEDEVDALIEDRRELVESARDGSPKSTGRDPDRLLESEDESEDPGPEALEEAYTGLW